LEDLKDFLGRKSSGVHSKNVITPIPSCHSDRSGGICCGSRDPSTIARDDKRGKQQVINIYTKNYKTLSNFIEYNTFIRINLFETNLKLESFCEGNKYFICDDIL